MPFVTSSYRKATSGNTAVLDEIHVGFADIRDYRFDAAGRLGSVDSSVGGWENQFSFDDESRLVRVAKKGDTEPIALRYDGRGFLSLGVREDDGLEMRPLYASEGLYMGVRRTPSAGDQELEAVFYFGNRPIAQWRKVGTAASTLTWLTTDHLGTPILATNASGTPLWSGGFEPFGRDYANAHAAHIRLRLPGQIDDPLWRDSDIETSLYYNVHRWYELQTGRYASVDPLGLDAGPNLFAYALDDPIGLADPLGLDSVGCTIPGPELVGQLVNSSPCRQSCCADHDRCFDDFNCSSGSWWQLASECRPGGCAACNTAVTLCVSKCLFGLDADSPARYYCANSHKFVRIPSSEFPDFQSAVSACDADHSGECCTAKSDTLWNLFKALVKGL